jgi:hypothetical protein
MKTKGGPQYVVSAIFLMEEMKERRTLKLKIFER